LLRTAWNKFLPGFPNPLLKIPAKQSDTKFRMPFTEDQLEKILEFAKSDAFIYPIIVTGICTAMRRGDCCLLRWGNVDLKNNFISVKTAKTGARVEIPIWPPLKRVLLESANFCGKFLENGTQVAMNEQDYVFPEQAKMYLENADGITLRVKKVLANAGVLDAVSGSVKSSGKAGKPRLRESSAYDFHSFRVTWVTIALAQDVPMEIVRRVTGHSTISVVIKHYFHPNREDFRRVLENKLPSALRCDRDTDPIPTHATGEVSFLIGKLRSMDRDNWKKIRDEILNFYEETL
jgi:integrase